MSIFSFKASEAEIQEQVDKYDQLKVHQSYRGIAVLTITALIFLGILISYLFGEIEGFVFEDFLYGFIIFLPFLIFTYLGHRWAIIGLGILFIIDRIAASVIAPSIMPIIWMIIILPYIWKALQVENIRKKSSNSTKETAQNKENISVYCSKCGTGNTETAKFCTNCGAELKQ